MCEAATPTRTRTRALPKSFLLCPREDLIVLLSRMLISLININDKYLPLGDFSSANLTRFHSRAPPGISIHDYLMRLAHYNSLENSILIVAIYYIDLLSTSYPSFSLNSLTVHRFLLTATTVASKGLCDYFCTNHHYAKVGGIDVNELNFLEMEFLEKVNWRIIPRNDETEPKSPGHDLLSPETKHRRVSCDSGALRALRGSLFGESLLAMGYAKDILDNYYKKMIDLVGAERIDVNSSKAPPAILYILEESDSELSKQSFSSNPQTKGSNIQMVLKVSIPKSPSMVANSKVDTKAASNVDTNSTVDIKSPSMIANPKVYTKSPKPSIDHPIKEPSKQLTVSILSKKARLSPITPSANRITLAKQLCPANSPLKRSLSATIDSSDEEPLEKHL